MASTRNQRSQWGLQVRALRTGARLDQVTLAAVVGVTQGTVSRWESGEMAPKGPARLRIASALGQPVDVVFPDS